MRFDDVFHDRQPETGAAFRFCPRAVDDVEPLEDMAERIEWYPGARVFYFYGDAVAG